MEAPRESHQPILQDIRDRLNAISLMTDWLAVDQSDACVTLDRIEALSDEVVQLVNKIDQEDVGGA